jgi:hypothetical protein
VKLLLTSAPRSSVGALAQWITVDRDDIAGLGAAYNDRPGFGRQRMAVASRRERCQDPADILDIDGDESYRLRGSIKTERS